MFIATLLIIANNWKQPCVPPEDDAPWYSCAVGHDSATESWMTLGPIVLKKPDTEEFLSNSIYEVLEQAKLSYGRKVSG